MVSSSEEVAYPRFRRDAEHVVIGHDHLQGFLFRIVYEQGLGVVQQDPPVRRLEDAAEIGIFSRVAHATESPGFRPVGDAVEGRRPQSAVTAAEHVVDLVVRQACHVVGAEILMVFVDVVFVQSAGRGDPDMAVGILRETVHFLVGQHVGNDAGKESNEEKQCFHIQK